MPSFFNKWISIAEAQYFIERGLNNLFAVQRFTFGLLTGFPFQKLEKDLAAAHLEIATLKSELQSVKAIVGGEFNERQRRYLDKDHKA